MSSARAIRAVLLANATAAMFGWMTYWLPEPSALQKIEFTFDGHTDDLLRYVDREIELYESRIAATWRFKRQQFWWISDI
jgi:hypothetical protein